MSWEQHIQASQELGFSKVTLILRPNEQGGGFNPVAYSHETDVATFYKDGNEDINENAELLKDWKDAQIKNFRFYGKKFDIVQRDTENGKWIVATTGKDVIVAKKFNTIWFIAYGSTHVKTNNALEKIQSQIWNALEEANV